MKLDVETVAAHLDILFGYKATSDGDLRRIKHLVEDTKDFIKAYCHRNDIPQEIVHNVLDKIVGDFIYLKKSQGDLTDGDGNAFIDFDKSISSVTVGDVSVSLGGDSEAGGLSPEAQFDNLIDHLRNQNRFLGILNSVRKVKWNVRRF